MAPLLPYLLAWLGGTLASLPAAVRFVFPHALPLGCALTGAVLLFRSRRWTPARVLAFCVLLPAGFFAPGWTDRFLPENHVLRHLDETRRASVTGRIEQLPQQTPERVRFQVDLEILDYGNGSIEVSGRAQITLYSTDPARSGLKAGDRVRFEQVRLKRPRNFKNPGRFDYERYMKSRGIDVTANLSRIERVHRLGAPPAPWSSAIRNRLREPFLASLNTLFPGETGNLLRALLLSDRDALSKSIQEAYLVTGLAHLMAVSGLHVGFVAGAGYLAFWPLLFGACLRYQPEWAQSGAARKTAALLALGPVLYYLVLVGARVSALRAGIMVSVVLLALLLGRQRHLWNALTAAAFVILLWDPEAVLDAGFQLSFTATAAVLGVIHFLTRIAEDPVNRMGERPWYLTALLGPPPPEEGPPSRSERWKARVHQAAASCVLISLAVFLATLPILIAHFNRVSLVGWSLNLLMVPLASIVIPVSLLTVVLGMAFPFVAQLPAFVLMPLLQAFLFLPQAAGTLPFASVHLPTPPDGWFVLYYAVLFLGVFLWWTKKKTKEDSRPATLRKSLHWSFGLALPAVLFWLLLPRFPLLPSETLRIAILDVGQGESIFVEFPNRQTFVLDGGGFYKNALDVGRRVVAPFLWSRGIGKIDYLAATHSDNDHISGLESLAGLFRIGHYLDGFPGTEDERLSRLQRTVLASGAEHKLLLPGTPVHIGEVRLLRLDAEPVLARPVTYQGGGRVGNERSLVIQLEYRDFSMLLTGDIGEKTERRLIQSAAPLRAEFLKSPHHGSRFSNSESFIDAVRPRAVIFSSGHLNWMQHPHPEVLRRYARAGAAIYRTDRDGSIHIATDGHRHVIEGYEH